MLRNVDGDIFFRPRWKVSGPGASSQCVLNPFQTTPSAAKIHFVLGRSRNYIFALSHLSSLRIWSPWDGNPDSWCGFLQNCDPQFPHCLLGTGALATYASLSFTDSKCVNAVTSVVVHSREPKTNIKTGNSLILGTRSFSRFIYFMIMLVYDIRTRIPW